MEVDKECSQIMVKWVEYCERGMWVYWKVQINLSVILDGLNTKNMQPKSIGL